MVEVSCSHWGMFEYSSPSIQWLLTAVFNREFGTDYKEGDELIVPDSAFEFVKQ